MTEVLESAQFDMPNSVADTETTDTNQDEVDKSLKKRAEPLNELVYSEECYVERLRIVKDSYMPAIGSASDITSIYTGPEPNEPIPTTTGGPPVPDDLALRWRIVWGNWLQLYEWHSGFLEKLKTLITRDPDRIPKLFIDSRAKLSSIYSKYCENHRKAALIAEQFRDYFEELRIHVGDKQDVVSHLMQPVQRIMRYQLPMEVIVKYTRVANLPSLPQWQKALEIMKEIPKDTQLILEATMINNLPRVLTTLGKIRIRGNLLVTCLNKKQFTDLILDITKCKNKINPCAAVASVAPVPVLMTDLQGEVGAANHGDDVLASFTGSNGPLNANSSYGALRFVPSRVFLFDKMLLVTEEEATSKGKKKANQSVEAFSQPTYQCKHSITVNNMKFESNWWYCAKSLPECRKALSSLEQVFRHPDEDRRFVLWEQSAATERYFIMDPIWLDARSSWVSELKDIHHMQEKLLQALQAPTKAAGFNMADPFPVDPALASWMESSRSLSCDQPPGSKCKGETGNDTHGNSLGVGRHLSAPGQQHHGIHFDSAGSSSSCASPTRKNNEATAGARTQRKWPSFSIRRPKLLLGGSGNDHAQHKDSANSSTPADADSASQKDLPASLTRTRSVERRIAPFRVLKLSSTASPDNCGCPHECGDQPRKCSLNINQHGHCPFNEEDATLQSNTVANSGTGTQQQRHKKRSLMASFFGRLKSASSTANVPTDPCTPPRGRTSPEVFSPVDEDAPTPSDDVK